MYKKYSKTVYIFLIAFLCMVSSTIAQETPEQQSAFQETEPTTPQPAGPYSYDLRKLIDKSKDNIKRVNEKMREQAIYRRNQKREDKAREYYKRAEELNAEGKLEEARELLEKAVRIMDHPEMKDYIKESQRRFRIQAKALQKEDRAREKRVEEQRREELERVDQQYKNAVSLYKQRKYKRAKEEFELIEETYADYKATRSYLKLAEQDIVKQEALDKVEQKKEIVRQKKEAEQARIRERDRWRKEIERKEKDREIQVEQQADNIYKQAITFYKNRQYLSAKEKFQEVEWVLPNHKATRRYLKRIDNDIEKEEERLVVEKQKILEQKQWDIQLEKSKLERQRVALIEKKEKERKSRVADEAAFIYESAVAYYDEKLYKKAMEKFLEVEELYPNFKKTKHYLEQISKKRPKEDLLKDADQIKALSRQAKLLYDQILALADDRYTKETSKGVFKIDRYFGTLLAEIERIQEQLKKEAKLESEREVVLQQEEFEREGLREANKVYSEALALYEAGKFEEAMEKFKEVEKLVTGFKSVHKYLERIEKEAELAKQKAEVERLKLLEDQDVAKVKALAERANVINREILEHLKIRTFDTIADKFSELNDIFKQLKEVKANMAARKQKWEEKQMADNKLREKFRKDVMKKRDAAKAVADPIVRGSTPEELQRQIKQRQTLLYEEGKRLYDNGKFEQAKIKFEELSRISERPKKAEKYIKKIDKKIEKKTKANLEEVTEKRLATEKYTDDKDKKRMDRDTVRREKRLAKQMEREKKREARKKKTESKRLADLQKKERRRKERNKKIKEKQMAKKKDEYEARLDKLRRDRAKKLGKEEEMAKSSKDATAQDAGPKKSVDVKDADQMTEKERKRLAREKDREYDRQRKKDKKQIREELRLAKMREREERRDREEEVRRKKEEIRIAREEEREKRKLLEEEKRQRRRDELERRREEKRLRKQELAERKRLLREEADRKREEEKLEREQRMEARRTIREQQEAIRTEREMIRQEFVAGVDMLYNEAVGSHQDGRFEEAREKFYEVEELMPDYKRTQYFLKRLKKDIRRQRSSWEPPIKSNVKTYEPSHFDTITYEQPTYRTPLYETSDQQKYRFEPAKESYTGGQPYQGDRNQAVSNALDMFEQGSW